MTHNPPSTTTTTAATKEPPPWHSAFPAPRSTAQSITRDQVRSMLLQQQQGQAAADDNSRAGKDFVLVDLRRNDHEGGTIHTSLNLPAQSLYPSIPTLYTLFKAAGVNRVIWYCGSSQGRGPRAAGWFADYIEDQQQEQQEQQRGKQADATTITSLVLEGGIKGWVAGGRDFTALVDGYVAEKWTEV